jgi:hypothetical protein
LSGDQSGVCQKTVGDEPYVKFVTCVGVAFWYATHNWSWRTKAYELPVVPEGADDTDGCAGIVVITAGVPFP